MTDEAARLALADRFKQAFYRYRPEMFGEDDKIAGPPLTRTECMEIVAALGTRGPDPAETMDDFIRAVLADNNPRSDEPYATVAKWIRKLWKSVPSASPPALVAQREALEPFAKAANAASWPTYEPDNRLVNDSFGLTVGDLRQARAALNATPATGGEK